MADYTKREQRAAEMRETLARDTDARYTIFSNDFDPACALQISAGSPGFAELLKDNPPQPCNICFFC